MRYIPTSKLAPGMALGQDIYDGAGRLLLAKHLLLSAEYISNLEFLGFPGIYIDDEFTRGIEIQQILTPQVRSQALKLIHDLFSFDTTSMELPVSEVKLRMTVESVMEDVLNNGDVMCNVLDIKDYDDYIYYHSVNVCVMSIMVGAWHGTLSREQLYQLAVAAILHDIGKKFLDADVVNGEWPLQGEAREKWKMHPKLGCEFLRSSFNFPSVVYMSVLMHHEWFDGSGYPLGRARDEIPLFARIIKMTDCYDSLTAKHPSKENMAPSDALEYLMAMAGAQFDPQIVNIFLRKMAVYPIGCEVELSNGQRAVVAENFRDFSLRPLVRVIESGEMINLRDDPAGRSITIGRMIM